MKKAFLISLSALFIFSGAACVRVQVSGADGGIFKSVDKGLQWEQKAALLSVGQPRAIGGLDASVLIFDPQDSQTLYLGAKDRGLFVSYNGANAWQEVGKLPSGTINAVAVDPRDKCNIYATVGGKIFKSVDCNRNWQNVYLEATPNVEITSLGVDSADNAKILAGLSDGRLLRSTNGGVSWIKMYEFNAKIKQILINPKNTGIIYVVTASQGLWRSADGGANWLSLDQTLAKYPGGRDVEQMIFDPTKSDSVLTVSNYGLLRSDDGGANWIDYKLLIPPQRVKIYSFAINPRNQQEIFYATATTFYRSLDGGKNWQTKSLPSKRLPIFLLVDPTDPNTIYMGVLKPAQ